MGTALAFSLSLSVAMPIMEVNAATNSVVRRYINGDGVRLRREGHLGGEVLELMYDGEPIDYYPYVFGSDSEYNYMRRLETKTYGYVDHHYVRNTP